jgi:hypothetical protein
LLLLVVVVVLLLLLLLFLKIYQSPNSPAKKGNQA